MGTLDRRTLLGLVLAGGVARTAAAQTARYRGQLVLLPEAGGRLMRLRDPYAFIDAGGREWPVPARAVVDGASIPKVFWSVVGGPWDGAYRNASVVHDWYCAVRTMPWKQTHRMFYDAMLASKVEPRQARLMFLAVRYAGPTWDDLTIANSRILTDNGQQRLDPPGTRHVTSGFASESEASQARASLLSNLQKFAADADRQNLDIADMERLVDQNGRAETAAAMLER